MLLGTANDKDTAEPGVMISPGARVGGPPEHAAPRLILPKQISQWKKAVNDWLDAQEASRIAADGYDRYAAWGLAAPDSKVTTPEESPSLSGHGPVV